MKKVVFICYGNACRSQMAEGFARLYGKNKLKVFSAGTNPLGEIVKKTYQVMQRKNIDITMQYSKGLDEIPLGEMDYVITMGCCKADEICPIRYKGNMIDWDIPDPYGGDINEFERVYDIIEKKIKDFVNSL